MDEQHVTDVIIVGAGIAGLWTAAHLTKLGYDVLLLEKNAIGGGQTIAAQGIIHSGFKYSLSGKVNSLAKAISAMPARWRKEVNQNRIASPAHHLMTPKGLVGSLMKITAEKTFAKHVTKLTQTEWAAFSTRTGFNGSIMALNEPVIDVPNVLKDLSAICHARKIDDDSQYIRSFDGALKGLWIKDTPVAARAVVFTAADSNLPFAKKFGHAEGVKTQVRPLLMGMMRDAPFPLFAHLIGASDKPVATITTHTAKDGALIWYIGGKVAEQSKNSWPYESYQAAKKAFSNYLPAVNFSGVEWAVHPVDRIEGKGGSTWLPDTPVIHQFQNAFYCWPTKLAFAPMLADRIEDALMKMKIRPSGTRRDYSFLPKAPFAKTPWDRATWKKLK